MNNNAFINSSSLKMLIALNGENLDPISLLYKVSLMDLKNDVSSNSIRNINAFGFYLRNYRDILNRLYRLYLIKVEDNKICLTFDGKGVLERLNNLEFVKSLMNTSASVKKENVSGYQELYICGLDQYTKKFVTKEGV